MKHEWEPTDTEGYSYECTRCGLYGGYVVDNAFWAAVANSICPGDTPIDQLPPRRKAAIGRAQGMERIYRRNFDRQSFENAFYAKVSKEDEFILSKLGFSEEEIRSVKNAACRISATLNSKYYGMGAAMKDIGVFKYLVGLVLTVKNGSCSYTLDSGETLTFNLK